MGSQPSQGPSLSIVLPAFNEAATIAQAVREAEAALGRLGCAFEIIVVDDGSADGTAEIAEAAGGPAVRVVRHAQNRGYGVALRTGFAASRGDLIGFSDADCQFDLGEIDRLVLLCRDHDAACGYRIDRQDPLIRRLLSVVYNLVVGFLFRIGVRDCDCALKLFRGSVLRQITLSSGGFFINAELLARLRRRGSSIVEVGVTHRPRLAGASTVSWRNSLPVLRAMLRFWWNWEAFPATSTRFRTLAWRPSAKTWLRFAALLALVVPLLFVKLSYPLLDPDETRYARIPAEMLTSGDFVVPTLQGEPYLDKPPLLYWVTAALFRVLGVGEHSARLPSALAMLWTVAIGFWLGRLVVGERAAWLGSLVFSLSLGFLGAGRFLSTDAMLVAAVTTALLAAMRGVGGDQYRPGWWTLAGVACGLGVLTKGPVALVLVLPPILAGRWLSASPVRLAPRRWIPFGLPLVAVTGPWFVLISRSRPEFLSHFLLRHHLERFVDAFDHAQPWWFFLPVFFLLLLPGSLALPSLAAMVLSRNPRVRALRRREDGYLALAAVWIIAFFSLSSSKLASYVLPALPVTGLLLGRLLDLAVWRELSESSVLSKAVPRGAVVAGLLLGGGLGLLDIALDGEPLVEGHLWAGGMVVASLAVGLVGVFERLVDGRQRWLLAAGLFWAGWTFLFFDLLPEAAYLRSLPRRARAVATLDPGKGFLPILAVGHRLGPGMMYMRRDEIEDLAPENVEPIRRRLELSARLVLIADREIAGQVVSYAPERTLEELDAEGHLFLIARRPDTGGSGGG